MSEKVKGVPLIPNWKAAAQIALMAIQNGTPEGAQAGEAMIIEMAEKFDKFIAQMHEAGHIEDPAGEWRE